MFGDMMHPQKSIHSLVDELSVLVLGSLEEDADIVFENISVLMRYGTDDVLCRIAEYLHLDQTSIYFPFRSIDIGRQMKRFWKIRLDYNEGLLDEQQHERIVCEFLAFDEEHCILDELEKQMSLINEIRRIYRATSSKTSRRKTTREHRLQGALFFQPKTKTIAPTRSLFDSASVVREILLSKTRIFSSSTFPISVSLRSDEGVSRVIYKEGDDMTQDLFVLETIRYISRAVGMDLQTYEVLVLSREEGLIEAVEGTDFTRICSGDELRRWTSDGECRERFMASLCAYTVICYVMGIGDRNLGNMLVNDVGSFFHIDFSHVFGRDPKPLAPRIVVPQAVREYLEEDELVLQSFVSRCVEAFLEVRMHHRKMFAFWSILLQNRIFRLDLNETRRFAGDRLMLTLPESRAAECFREEVRAAVGSYRTTVMHLVNRIGSFLRK